MPKYEYEFDTSVQELKHKVLREIAKMEFDGHLLEGMFTIPQTIVPGPNATMRCCIYKERAIVSERIHTTVRGMRGGSNVVEVLEIACDECPVSQLAVGDSCRGCIAHHCVNTCPKDAIEVRSVAGSHIQKAHIDPDKCIQCGRCTEVCPYHAITKNTRPCEKACKTGAVSMDDNKKAKIDDEKCISCGACVYACPFGAIVDRSDLRSVIRLLKRSENNTKYRVYAIVAPSIASQVKRVPLGKVIAAIKELGFHNVIEAALGADMVAYREAEELPEKGFMTSSCCPAFVSHVRKHYPELEEHISSNLSPMAALGQYLKESDPTAKVVFFGPCIAKKAEAKEERVRPFIDGVLTFEEMVAMFAAKDIDIPNLEEEHLDNASHYGRLFARSGGVAEAVGQAIKERGEHPDFEFNPISCSGIEECKVALMKASKGVLKHNMIEGMACVDGCIGGPAGIHHGPKDRKQVDAYGKEAKEKNITDAVSVLGMTRKKKKNTA